MKGMVKGGEMDGAAGSEAGGDFSRIAHERTEEEEKKSREIWGQGVFKYSSWEGGLLRGCLWAVSPELLTRKERRKEGRSAVSRGGFFPGNGNGNDDGNDDAPSSLEEAGPILPLHICTAWNRKEHRTPGNKAEGQTSCLSRPVVFVYLSAYSTLLYLSSS